MAKQKPIVESLRISSIKFKVKGKIILIPNFLVNIVEQFYEVSLALPDYLYQVMAISVEGSRSYY